ncbi:MAG: [Fe-Fe] hydrogenase large subunit C-terminal domain-containing protein [Eubacteriales bacterium]|nr:[Fe-Fe] hydrogenase large subunit C-terminal domain-containing protein [Eubacteriales bacterium]
MDKFFHSVRIDKDLCKGCINCIKRCPTEAIRVRNGKAVINNKLCIDCGECIRICENHAKYAEVDSLKDMERFKYTIALPAPTLYCQFNNLEDKNIVLNALLKMGFDDVFEVAAAAEFVSEAQRKFLAEKKDNMPWISTACPTIIRLVRVRFPGLIKHLMPINPPVEVAAQVAVKKAMEKTGLKREEIGTVFISPCPSKNTYAKVPLGIKKSEIDLVIAMKEIYPKLLTAMKAVASENYEDISQSGRIGISWGFSGGEAGGALAQSYLAADGIENVIRVLEDLEDEKLDDLEFVELDACAGGCVGGVLTVENPYLSVARLHKMRRYMPIQVSHMSDDGFMDEELEKKSILSFKKDIEYEPVLQMGDSVIEGFVRLNQAERLAKTLPGLDCGSCGAPSCSALAKDIVKGEATQEMCIYMMRSHIADLSKELKGTVGEVRKVPGPGAVAAEYIEKIADRIIEVTDKDGIGR